MASLYKRPRSPFWWIQYRDVTTREARRESTKFRHDDPNQTRFARQLRVKHELEEIRTPRQTDHMRWGNWVPAYIDLRHAVSPRTAIRKHVVWRTLYAYFDEQKIPTPAHLTREHCLNYVAWRKANGHLLAKRKGVAHNTVLLDLKILASIVEEAVRRQWIPSNPCSRLEIAREMPKVKPELSDSDIELIRAGIAAKFQRTQDNEDGPRLAEFLRVSFEIALAQGCRLFETYLDLDNVNLDHMEITFLAKGRKEYVAPLSPELIPLFKEMKERGQRFTYDLPRMPSLVWFKFMDNLRRKHPQLERVSFHSTRVTVISRLGRGGVPQPVAMALVNHSSTTMHRVYRRIAQSELPAMWSALKGLAPK